jgi:hypothetical protein
MIIENLSSRSLAQRLNLGVVKWMSVSPAKCAANFRPAVIGRLKSQRIVLIDLGWLVSTIAAKENIPAYALRLRVWFVFMSQRNESPINPMECLLAHFGLK